MTVKMLIVDDNPDIGDVLKDILSEEGHNVRIARTIDEAVFKTQSFVPEIVILDSHVGGEDGIRYLTRLDAEASPCRPAVIYMKAEGEIAPGDNPLIRSSIDKPFRSEDLIYSVANLAESLSQPETKNRRRRNPACRRCLKKVRYKEPVKDALEDHGVEFGTSYVLFSRERDDIYRFISLFDMMWYNVMVITTARAKAVEERFSYGAMEVISLSSNGKAGSTGIMEIGTMAERAKEFIDSSARPVIVFDGFDDIIRANGTNQPLVMVQQIIKGRSKACTVALSVDGSNLTEKDRGILLRIMNRY